MLRQEGRTEQHKEKEDGKKACKRREGKDDRAKKAKWEVKRVAESWQRGRMGYTERECGAFG